MHAGQRRGMFDPQVRLCRLHLHKQLLSLIPPGPVHVRQR